MSGEAFFAAYIAALVLYSCWVTWRRDRVQCPTPEPLSRRERLIAEGMALSARAENDHAGRDGVPRDGRYYALTARAEAKFDAAREERP